jgi:serine/threonine protein kinase
VFYRWEEEVALCDYLRRNSRTISLATKLHIMTQVCSLLQYLHKRNIGYFI